MEENAAREGTGGRGEVWAGLNERERDRERDVCACSADQKCSTLWEAAVNGGAFRSGGRNVFSQRVLPRRAKCSLRRAAASSPRPPRE